MTHPIGIRIPKEILENIERISKKEMEDRSTVLRKLLILGYKEFAKKKAAEEYVKGNIVLSEAAGEAGLTIWEMEKYLVENGYKSSYSIEDLEKELEVLK